MSYPAEKPTPKPGRPLTATGNPATEKGFALLIVVVVMLLLSFLASRYIMLVRSESQVAFNVKQNTSSRFLARAGINLGLFYMLDSPMSVDSSSEEQFQEGRPYQVSLSTGTITYYVVNETGKIDLNSAPPGLLELFLEHHEMEPDDIATIIDSLADWRDNDTFHRLHGAEKDIYQEMTPPYIPRNGNIIEPAEFFLIYGTETLVGKFSADEVFTVHNPTRRINFNSLTPAMLAFLTGNDQEKIEGYHSARAESGVLTANHAQMILGEENFSRFSKYLSYTSGSNSNYFIVAIGQAGYSLEAEEQEGHKDIPGIKIKTRLRKERTGVKFQTWKEDFL